VDDILYVLEQGTIDDDSDDYGKSVFGEEVNNYADKSAFTCGILVFKRCETINVLFNNILHQIRATPAYFRTYDQPYIIYNAFKYNLYNNKALIQFAISNNDDITSVKTIHFFQYDPPDFYMDKVPNMANFLNALKLDLLTKNVNNTIEFISTNLIDLIKSIGEPLEGNVFMYHQTNYFTEIYREKVYNICSVVLNKNVKRVLEIGFGSGFSTLLFLISNPTLQITCVDINTHSYTMPCYLKIKEFFGDRINLLVGDSNAVLPTLNEAYDVIHIDGSHTIQVAEKDITECYRLSKNGTVLILNEYDVVELHSLWDDFVKQHNLQEMVIYLYKTIFQDIKYVVK
jgi:predicted O-methyltransferase YrrM